MRTVTGAGRIVAGLVAIAVLGIVAKDAWVCDDAYITFRHVDHLWLGHGLEWNVGERVLVSTHALWLVLLSLLQPLTGQPFWSALGLSLACTGGALALIVARDEGAGWAALGPIALLGSSKAFVDFSTSGLENPLTHLLLVVGTVAASRERDDHLGLAAGMLLLNRLDTALLVAPLLAWRLFATRGAAARRLWPVAAIPGAWMAFSLVYFGEPLPNTALAKLAQQIPAADRVTQGLDYLANSWAWDPVTLGALAIGLLTALVVVRRDPVALALALGGVLGTAYAVRIGGDFMSGRFLTAPLVCGALALARAMVHAPGRPALAIMLAGSAVAVSATSHRSPLRTDLDYSDQGWDETGIADERGFYFRAQGLWPMLRDGRGPVTPGRPETTEHEDTVIVERTIGARAYAGGPHLHVIDRFALSDALLARLPVRYAPGWRPGHWDRPMPEGYRATLRSGRPQLRDPAIARCFERVQAVHAGPLFTRERWAAIWTLNTTGCTDLWGERWMHPQTTEWQWDGSSEPVLR